MLQSTGFEVDAALMQLSAISHQQSEGTRDAKRQRREDGGGDGCIDLTGDGDDEAGGPAAGGGGADAVVAPVRPEIPADPPESAVKAVQDVAEHLDRQAAVGLLRRHKNNVEDAIAASFG